MRKMIITLIFSLIFAKCIAPTLPNFLVIPESEPLYIYGLSDPVTRSVAWFESRFKPYVVNKHSGARGLMQITPIMIKEVNKICKKTGLPHHYTWKDAFNPYKSIEIWYIVQDYHNPEYDIEKSCRIWFGSGVQYDGMTWKNYVKHIKNRLQNDKQMPLQ